MGIRKLLFVVLLLTGACGGAAKTNTIANGANVRTEQGCEAGHGDDCALLGMSHWLQAQAHGSDESPALAPFESACELGEWFGCAMASSIQAKRGQDATESAKKTYPLAENACKEKSDASACAFLGDWATRAKAGSLAMKNYARACGLSMTADTREQVLEEYVCTQAIALGADRDTLVPARVPGEIQRDARRTSGATEIHPSYEDARAMARRGIKKAGSEVLLCLSAAGVPRKIYFTQFSEFPRWNQAIFESIRRWRYSPMIDAAGKPVPVCTSVTFYYLPAS